MRTLISRFWRDQSGLSAVEYAIAGGLVVAGMVVAFRLLGTNATAKIDNLATQVGQ